MYTNEPAKIPVRRRVLLSLLVGAGLLAANRSKMRTAAGHLLSLINDVLQMSKLESGQVTLSHEPLRLSQLTTDVLAIVGQRASDSGITMEYTSTLDAVTVDWVYGSPVHLRQIFLNIYSNCIKYNKPGGKICSHVDCLSSDGETVTYRWSISDTGIGMSQAFLAQIFDPFTQARSDARSVYQGTGLGMAIVKSLVEKMNGTIEIRSREGVGTTFLITLPFRVAQAPAAESQAPTGPASSIRGRRLLMDMMMPVMDGLAATRAIRALDRPDAKTIPIIATTANAFAKDAEKCIASGMNAHLPKPLQVQKVIETIAHLCDP